MTFIQTIAILFNFCGGIYFFRSAWRYERDSENVQKEHIRLLNRHLDFLRREKEYQKRIEELERLLQCQK